MSKQIVVGTGESRSNPIREIHLGPLKYLIESRKESDLEHIVYKLSYGGKYIIIKGKSLVGSLIILADTLNSFDEDNERFKGHLYSHLYRHLMESEAGRFRIKEIAGAGKEMDFYDMLKQEQMALDAARYDPCCLNNQTEVYIPKYSEKTGMYGWIPKNAVMNFNRWLSSAERKAHADQYKRKP